MAHSRRFAFFDVDDTLISAKSMFSFQDFWYAQPGLQDEAQLFQTHMARLRADGATREELNYAYYTHFTGRRPEEVEAVAAAWFQDLRERTPDLLHMPVVERLKQHQSDGVPAVFVSGSFPALLAPCAALLDVEYMLCTNMEISGGLFSGKILPPQTIGAGKATAIRSFLEEQDARSEDCFAYGDDISDLSMLQAVGTAVAIGGHPGLEKAASENGWEILSPR